MRLTLLITALAAIVLAQPHSHRRLHGHNLAHQSFHAKRAPYTKFFVETETITKTRYIGATATTILGPSETPPSEPKTTKDTKLYQELPKTTSQVPPPAKEPTPTPQPEPEPTPELESTPEPETPKPSTPADKPSYEVPGLSTGGGGGDSRTGDLTYYTVGMGSCGIDDSGKGNTDYIVAVSKDLMGEQSNGNPICGKTATISNGKKSVQATIRDKCGGCAVNDLDASERVFLDLFGDLDVGRDTVTWSIN